METTALIEVLVHISRSDDQGIRLLVDSLSRASPGALDKLFKVHLSWLTVTVNLLIPVSETTEVDSSPSSETEMLKKVV